MSQKKSNQEEEQPAGAPDWMVTFSDCMTLLLTFFVLLLSFSTFGKKTLPRLGESFAKALPSIGLTNITEQDSMWENKSTKYKEKLTKGTETPTTVDQSSSNFMREKKPLDFRNLKVFSTESGKIFWGNGNAISKDGTIMLDALATFLKTAPSRIVISENGPGEKQQLGLERAWAVVECLTKQKGLRKERFSITAKTTMQYSQSSERMFEITLLERNIYQ
jgi:flagellar motor protein MotB